MKTPLEIFEGKGRIEILDADGIPVAHIYHHGRANGANYAIDGKANAAQIIDAVNAAHRADDAGELAKAAEVIAAAQRVVDIAYNIKYPAMPSVVMVGKKEIKELAAALAAHDAGKGA